MVREVHPRRPRDFLCCKLEGRRKYNIEHFLIFYIVCLSRILITPWRAVLLGKITVLQLVKKFPTCYGTRRFMRPPAALILDQTNQYTPSHYSSSTSILILSSYLRLDFPSGLFPSDVPSPAFLFSPMHTIRSAHLIPPPSIPLIFGKKHSFLHKMCRLLCAMPLQHHTGTPYLHQPQTSGK